jgi:hypothetical protein
MYEASIPEFSFRKTGVCNVITKKIFAKYVLNSDLRPQMHFAYLNASTLYVRRFDGDYIISKCTQLNQFTEQDQIM